MAPQRLVAEVEAQPQVERFQRVDFRFKTRWETLDDLTTSDTRGHVLIAAAKHLSNIGGKTKSLKVQEIDIHLEFFEREA